MQSTLPQNSLFITLPLICAVLPYEKRNLLDRQRRKFYSGAWRHDYSLWKKWYWYGENKNAPNLVINGELQLRVPFTGIGCYSIEDLHIWHNEGLMLSPVHDAEHPLDVDRIAERPKVLYCEKTGKYVMWFHDDRKDYTLAEAGVAVADRPEGSFQFLQLVLPNRRDCRDMTLFQDPLTSKAYLLHSGDWNKTLYFSELTDDYAELVAVSLHHLR